MSKPDSNQLPALFLSTVSKEYAPKDVSTSLRVENESEKIRQMLLGKQKSMQKTIGTAGFSCLMCGKCCERAEDDNSVYILPAEIEKIESKGFSRSDFILPLLPDFYNDSNDISSSFQYSTFTETLRALSEQIDEHGRIHTFGWMLQRKEDGSCIFLSESKKCLIYDIRPALCHTYPFFADENGVSKCECEGLESVSRTEPDLTNELTKALQNRVVADQADYIQTSAGIKEYYEQFTFNSECGIAIFEENLKKNVVSFVVYDGTGVYAAEIQLK
ncbi:hypothetical protein MmiEs2_06580 [Methanimicrococcus stummii]|uniref:YkgJ family cysteine cluster protein n=1 Tax=Methanimicrococcus stummii TaxID=3028294 RepID=A0AA96VA41_9EURY|nr:YkgJ family cysteine cluster protein [Methanimicrococcus sp. Es2]WNY28470.1 hypothetical protein MmiEs2_06580 [Methanimicrococcus sp. Es2]